MTKLIGTNPNQVPSNADLGTAAFMDKKDFLLSRGSSLSAINAVISKVAVDVFIYDTTTDSDGGAWRKKAKHTSWYNEPLDGVLRGSKREFPQVALIVAEQYKILIYDVDNNFDLWMAIDQNTRLVGGGSVHWATGYFEGNRIIRRVTASHGVVAFVCGTTNATGAYSWVMHYSFPEDRIRRYSAGGASPYGRVCGDFIYDIARRHESTTTTYQGFTYNSQYDLIGSDQVIASPNVVGLVAEPNADIDPNTGLPKLTIGVGLTTGLTIIRYNGDRIDRSAAWTHQSLPGGVSDFYFDDRGGYWYLNAHYHETHPSAPNHAGLYAYTPSLTTTGDLSTSLGTSQNSNDLIKISQGTNNAPVGYWGGNFKQYLIDAQDSNVGYTTIADANIGSRSGLTKVYPDYTDGSKVMLNYIDSNHNTGWMPGDARVAVCCDVYPNDIVADQIINNGDFSSTDVSDWGTATNTTVSVVNGQLVTTTSGASNYEAANYFAHGLIAGKTYLLSVDVVSTTGSFVMVYVAGSASTANPSFKQQTFNSNEWIAGRLTPGASPNGTHQLVFEAQSNGYLQIFTRIYQNGSITIDNLSLRQCEANETAYGASSRAFEAHGIIKKKPVASGAELVSYSGFGTNTALVQRHNTEMQFRTGDYYMMAWLKHSGDTNAYVVSIHDPNSSSHRTAIEIPTGNVYRFLIQSTGSANYIDVTHTAPEVWHHVCMTRKDGVAYIYINGMLKGSFSNTDDLNGTNSPVTIGNAYLGSGEVYDGEISLVKIGATGLTLRDVEKIYHDEKKLFEINAKATFYDNTSNEVRGLAYDKSTDLLHVGTSTGRSIFQGLCRVGHESRAVETAISAVDGLVVEE